MFSHMMVGSNDIDRARTFYDAVFGAIGREPGIVDPKGRLIYRHAGSTFMVSIPLDGRPAIAANGGTVGFEMASPEQAGAWHAAGVAAGGTSVEDPPGWRDRPGFRLYLAYLRDPDGNKLCALYREG